jgi:hypothetical protein
MKIEHGPKPTDFHYHAYANGTPIDNPKELKLDKGESILFESPDKLSLRFSKSPFVPAKNTSLNSTWNGNAWTIPAVVGDHAVYGTWYHYTVTLGDSSTDDPEIIIEQL